jgi:hypothetical protein
MKKFKYGRIHGKTSIIYFSLLASLFYNCTIHAGQPIASINGAVCSFNTIADAIAAAQPNDTINIKGGTHTQLIGEIPISLTLVASRGATGCEFSDSLIFATIDGMGQTFDATGGLVKITNGAKVTFRNMALTNASAINGGIMAIVDGSSVALDNVDIYGGSALTAGGNVYLSAGTGIQSGLVMDNGSRIYSGTVVTGDGGGLALYGSKLLINDGSIGLMGIDQGNSVSNNGGGIYAENSTIVINNFDSHIQNNQADNFGGGIYTVGSTMTITNATVNDNTTDFNGGGIYSDSSNIVIIDATISGNITTKISGGGGGGGLYLTGPGEIIIDLTTIISNISKTVGGGILNAGNTTMLRIINGSDIINNSASSGGGIFTLSPLTVDSSIIRFNTASLILEGSGGGIRCHSCQSLSVVNSSQISNNTAMASGGGISVFSTSAVDVELINSTFTGNNLTNSDSSFGGGISQDGGTILIDTCTISSNSGATNGGGVFLFDLDSVADSVRIINSQFFNNTTSLTNSGPGGGALYLSEIFSAHIFGSEFSANYSSRNGGGINVFDSDLIVSDSIISNNNALFEGGGIHAEDCDLIIKNSSIIQNEAIDFPVLSYGNLGGGGIKSLNSNLDIINSKINQNISNDIGGGIFYEGNTSNSISIKSVYGILSGECLPATLGFNEYCSEVSNNAAIFGAGLMIRGSTNEQGINLSGVALNANNAIDLGPSIASGVAIQLDITNPLDTEVAMENLILVENNGISDLNRSVIFIGGRVVLNLSSTTIANNTVSPIRSGFNNSSIVIQNSIIQQNNRGPEIFSSIPIIGLCNNSQPDDLGVQIIGPDLGDPQFIFTNRGEYRLSMTSPSLDSCSFGALLDIDGNVRPNDNGNYDQGAFEMNAGFVVDEIFADGFEL